MLEDLIEFNNVFMEDMGALIYGSFRISAPSIFFKNLSTGKVISIHADDILNVYWQRLANKPGLKVITNKGLFHRFGGFKDTDFNKFSEFTKNNWSKELIKKDLCIKGWNYGDTKFEGQNLIFEIDNKSTFEIPLSNVSNCSGGTKSEVSLEFHANDDCPVQLVEMRLHIPQDPEKSEDFDSVEEFRKAVMKFAEVEGETDQPLVTLPQILCTTPRGRYDIKVFQNQLFFHGKTYDYKIPFKSVTRMFLLPHKDGRHMFFVLHINPPIRQGQTRYPFLVLEFSKEEYIEVDLGLTEEQLKTQFDNKLESHMRGLLYEIMAKLFRVLIKSKIIIPGNFIGASGTPGISCALRQASGILYPLEKGFVCIHKPPMYIRFEEIDNIHFARSDVSTRSFDFEIVQKTGTSILFSSVGKEEYNKLFDFVQSKGLKIRNATRLPDKPNYSVNQFKDSDEELDPYKEGLKQDVIDRNAGSNDSDTEDEDFDVNKEARKQKTHEKDSSEGSGSEPNEEFDDDSDDSVSDDILNSKPKKRKEEKPKKEKEKKSSVIVASSSKGRKEDSKKKRKDPNAPKRNQTSFFIWLNENRSKIKKEGDSLADTGTRAGAMWKEMTEADKQPYEKKAKEDKERYEREMREYKANKPSMEDANETTKKSNPSQSSSKSKTYSSPTKKAISKEFVETDSNDSSDENKKMSKKSVGSKHKKTVKDKPPSESSSNESVESSDKDSN